MELPFLIVLSFSLNYLLYKSANLRELQNVEGYFKKNNKFRRTNSNNYNKLSLGLARKPLRNNSP
jgi:hypothetical protein